MKVIITTILLFMWTGMYSQTDFDAIEREIVKNCRILQYAYDDGIPERQVIFAKKIKQQLLYVLLQEGSYYYAFDRLKQYINIHEAADKKLRVFSWNNRKRMAWQEMTTLIQFRGVSNESYVHVLSPTIVQQSENDFRDVCIDAVYTIETNIKTYYLLLGKGSHGGGQHHAAARIFYLGHNKIEECLDCFEGYLSYWSIALPQQFEIRLNYHPYSQKLSYQTAVYNPKNNQYNLSYQRLLWRRGKFRNE